jgi:hypothetical protein
VLWRLLPLSEAVIVAVPGATAATGTTTARAPVGTVTVAGTEAMPAALLPRVMTVSAGWAALIVAVRVPVLP